MFTMIHKYTVPEIAHLNAPRGENPEIRDRRGRRSGGSGLPALRCLHGFRRRASRRWLWPLGWQCCRPRWGAVLGPVCLGCSCSNVGELFECRSGGFRSGCLALGCHLFRLGGRVVGSCGAWSRDRRVALYCSVFDRFSLLSGHFPSS
jgi:hypothetical protein